MVPNPPQNEGAFPGLPHRRRRTFRTPGRDPVADLGISHLKAPDQRHVIRRIASLAMLVRDVEDFGRTLRTVHARIGRRRALVRARAERFAGLPGDSVNFFDYLGDGRLAVAGAVGDVRAILGLLTADLEGISRELGEIERLM